MKIYVASSWQNAYQLQVVEALRALSHDVYDFRNPGPGEAGFSWAEVDSGWQRWTVEQFKEGFRHPRARHAFERDRRALKWCDLCLLVLPSGMSAHLEAGWCAGRAKPVLVYAPEFRTAELMYGLFVGQRFHIPIAQSLDEALSLVEEVSVEQSAERANDDTRR